MKGSVTGPKSTWEHHKAALQRASSKPPELVHPHLVLVTISKHIEIRLVADLVKASAKFACACMDA